MLEYRHPRRRSTKLLHRATNVLRSRQCQGIRNNNNCFTCGALRHRLVLFLTIWTIINLTEVSASSSSNNNNNGAAWNEEYYNSRGRRIPDSNASQQHEQQQQRQRREEYRERMWQDSDPSGRPQKDRPPPRDGSEWWQSPEARPPPPQQQQQHGQPPPQQQHTPIHYQFQETRADTVREEASTLEQEDDGGIPRTWNPPTEGRPAAAAEEDPDPTTASPRRDAVTRYMATRPRRLLLRTSAGMVGAGAGGFLGKSLLHRPLVSSITLACFVATFLCTYFRNPYGELARALGLALIYALQRTRAIRRRYPTWRHVQSCLGAAPRRPFPPAENPWSSKEINMLHLILAMALVGSACGGNLPVLPTWLGALLGAGLLVWTSTLKSARGDLARTMGIRVVALMEEVLDINGELRLASKLGVVSGRILDKLLILDRKHRIKDKIVGVVQWGIRQGSRTVSQVQADMQRGEEGEGGPSRRRREPGYQRGGDEEYSDERRRDEQWDEYNGERRRRDRTEEYNGERRPENRREEEYGRDRRLDNRREEFSSSRDTAGMGSHD